MSRFKNQIAIVTGASSDIGKAIALNLAVEGASLCLIGRNLPALDAITESAKITTSLIKSYKIDLTIDADIENLRACIQKDFGHVDILIHSAGVFSMGMLEYASVKDLDRLYKTNIRAPYLLTQTLLPMIKSRHGQIVFINSSAGLSAQRNLSQYAATKGALKAVADSLRAEVNAAGVRVLSVFPGRTATPMQEEVHKSEGREYRREKLMQPEDIAAIVVDTLMLPRTAEVTDINIRPFVKCD